MKYNILLVEDQREISDIISKYLTKEGFGYFAAKDGFEALEYFNNHECHIVILDIMMPGIDGFEVLDEIRKISDVPIIMLTARLDETDRIKGFDKGADDYVLKPFSVRELMGRIKAIIKRVYGGLNDNVYTYGNLSLHSKSMKLFKDNQEIIITSAEYKLLLTLFRNKGQVLTREQLINLSYGQEYEGYDRNIDTYIKRIRKKIENNPKKPKILITKYGAGYIFGGESDDN